MDIPENKQDGNSIKKGEETGEVPKIIFFRLIIFPV
jgi:hypothetical protein